MQVELRDADVNMMTAVLEGHVHDHEREHANDARERKADGAINAPIEDGGMTDVHAREDEHRCAYGTHEPTKK